jgi:hypothetical protein
MLAGCKWRIRRPDDPLSGLLNYDLASQIACKSLIHLRFSHMDFVKRHMDFVKRWSFGC